MITKTIMIYDNMEGDLKFMVLKGDHTIFNGFYVSVSGNEEELETKFLDLTSTLRMLKDFPIHEVDADTAVIVCGFMP
jgi:hypothetical protein